MTWNMGLYFGRYCNRRSQCYSDHINHGLEEVPLSNDSDFYPQMAQPHNATCDSIIQHRTLTKLPATHFTWSSVTIHCSSKITKHPIGRNFSKARGSVKGADVHPMPPIESPNHRPFSPHESPHRSSAAAAPSQWKMPC